MPLKRKLSEDIELQPDPTLWPELELKRHAFRQKFPVRAPGVTHIKKTRPNKAEQRRWHSYTDSHPDKFQQWFLAPFVINCGTNPTKPLAGGGEDDLTGFGTFRVWNRSKWEDEIFEHYTNIHRLEVLASKHPLVESVQQHKIDKSLEESRFNAVGRCTHGHQSPWDLKLTLEASGAAMLVGVSVNDTAAGFLVVYIHFKQN